jgi:hypothetical protein
MRYAPLMLVVSCAALAGCGGSDPEAAVRARLEAAEAAAEARDAGFFGDLIAASYSDSRGNDRAAVMRLVRGYFLANQRVEILSRVDDVRLMGDDAAEAVVYAGIAGQRSGAERLGGIGVDLYRFDLELVSEGGEWQIIGARWARALGE